MLAVNAEIPKLVWQPHHKQTLAGIVNGNSLTRGLIGLGVLLSFQYLM